MTDKKLSCRYLVVQVHPSAHPRDEKVNSNFLTGTGVLLPMSADGFYSDFVDANAVAKMLRVEFPSIDVYVAEVVSINGEPK